MDTQRTELSSEIGEVRILRRVERIDVDEERGEAVTERVSFALAALPAAAAGPL